ncbi:hypothetical protein K449DRAFT_465713 [Hypoxylon sp. EC38]|nr:hypothetical protein K449DRAFT_465713 [Hypoxylon sp. EC38]
MASSDHFEPDIDRGTILIALFSVECSVSLLFLFLRLWARSSIRARGWDDIFMIITWILFAVATVFIGVIGAKGGARHIYYLDHAQAIYMTELNWIIQPFVIMALGTGKIAVCILFLRIFGSTSKWRTRTIWFLMILPSILTILTVIFTFAQCKEAAALWDSDVRKATYCWEPHVQSDFSISTQSVNCAVDFILAFLPLTFIWNLRLSLRKKVAVFVLLSGALFSGICAAIKTSQLVHLASRSDFTWEMFWIHIWTGTEIFVIIICGSIPTLSPLWERFSCGKTSPGCASLYGANVCRTALLSFNVRLVKSPLAFRKYQSNLKARVNDMQEQLPARPLLAAYVANLVSLPSRLVSALVTTLTTIAKITGNSISPCWINTVRDIIHKHYETPLSINTILLLRPGFLYEYIIDLLRLRSNCLVVVYLVVALMDPELAATTGGLWAMRQCKSKPSAGQPFDKEEIQRGVWAVEYAISKTFKEESERASRMYPAVMFILCTEKCYQPHRRCGRKSRTVEDMSREYALTYPTKHENG